MVFPNMIFLLAVLDPVYGSFLEELYQNNKNRVYSQAYSIVKNKQDAEEIVQDVFLKTYHHIEKLENRNPGQIMLWFRQCTQNRAIDFLRRKKQPATVSLHEDLDSAGADVPDCTAAPEELYINREMLRAVLKKVRALPFEQSTAILFRYYFHMSEKEIAEIMGKKPSAVSSLIYRAKKKLKEELEDLMHE